MHSHCRDTRPCLFLLACSLLVAAPAAASVTFLGQVGSASSGRVVVGWTQAGVADSLVSTFGMTPDVLYAGASFQSLQSQLLPESGIQLQVQSGLEVAPAGPAGRAAPVATGSLSLYDSGLAVSPARWAQSTLDFALRYTADQPTIYWALSLGLVPGDGLPPGPAGDWQVSHPVADVEPGCGEWCWGTTTGSAPNTGTLEIRILVEAIRPEGLADQWWSGQDFKVFLSDSPLMNFPAAVPGATPELPHVSLAVPRPNPARSEAMLEFSLPHPARATLEILDLAGRRLRMLVDGDAPAGSRSVGWDGRSDSGVPVGAGVYFVRLAAGSDVVTRRLVRLP